MAKKKGLIARLMEGPERSETYARSTLPTNRWELGWDTFKTNKGKLVGLNLLTLLFALPLIAVFIFRYMMKVVYTATLPFGQNLGMGYPVYPATAGLSAGLSRDLNLMVFITIPVVVAILAVGIAGGFYVMRNMIWAEGVMVGSDFWKGVKNNYFVVFFSLLAYSVVMVLSVLSINSVEIILAAGQGVKWLLVVSEVITYVIMAVATLMVMYMITLGITYKLSFRHLIRNAFILSVALLPTNVFFFAFSAVWFVFLILGINMFLVIGVIFLLVWGVSLFMLVWTDYSHWVFDKFINDKVPGAKKNKGIYKPSKVDTESEVEIIEKSKLTSRPIKPITDYDVEIYELPTSFSRKDLEKLEETKEAMRRDSDRYAEEHKDDYAEAEKNIEALMNDAESGEKDLGEKENEKTDE